MNLHAIVRSGSALAVAAFTGLALTACAARGATIHAQYEGSNANVTVGAGPAVTGADWFLEFDVNDATADGNANAALGQFFGAITGARIEINGTLHELAGTSATGNVSLVDASKLGSNGDRASVNPSSGGFVQFITGDNIIYTPVFGDNNFLTSAVLGASVADITTDTFNNQSIISFQSTQRLNAAGGYLISIFEASGPASGNFRFTISGTSAFAPAVVPEPSTIALVCVGLAGVPLLRRRGARRG